MQAKCTLRNFIEATGLRSIRRLPIFDHPPAKGAVLIAAPLKIENGTGSPIRALALVPRA